MLKTHGHRRLALLLALVFVTSMLAACSSSQSSTDEALSHPGKDYLGTIRVDVDPKNVKFDVSVINDATSNTALASNFSVDTTGIGFAADTITGNMKFKWVGPERLEQVSIRAHASSGIGLNAELLNADTCKGKTLGACFAASGQEGIIYAGETVAEAPETEYECQGIAPACDPRSERGLRLMSPGCETSPGVFAGNSITAIWRMKETTSGNPKYSFNARIYGTTVTPVMKDDPRYDADTVNVHLKAYAPMSGTSTLAYPGVNTARPLTTVKTGQWFYVLSYVDSPGDKSRGQNTKQCDDGDGDTQCFIHPVDSQDYDFYYIEDQANFDALTASSWWKTLSSYNTGFLFCGHAAWMIQWDPAVLQCNDCSQGVGTSMGSGNKSFRTKGAAGTKMYSYNDTNLVDQWADDTTLPSGWANRCLTGYIGNFAYPTSYPPLPDWLDVDDYGTGVTQGDYPSGYLALKAIGASGTGAPIRLSPSGNTIYAAGLGNKSPNPNIARWINVQKSTNYPTWAAGVGVGEGIGGSIGHYNEQIAWVCVQ